MNMREILSKIKLRIRRMFCLHEWPHEMSRGYYGLKAMDGAVCTICGSVYRD